MQGTPPRSPSLPLIRRHTKSKSNLVSNRSDSEPTMCLSLTPTHQRQPSIVLTRASVENEDTWNGSIGSRLPSHLSLGSSNITPAPTSPLSMFYNERSFPPNRSVTPLLFPEHHVRPTSPYRSRHTSSLLAPSPLNQPHKDSDQARMRQSHINISLCPPPGWWTRSPSLHEERRRKGKWVCAKQTDC